MKEYIEKESGEEGNKRNDRKAETTGVRMFGVSKMKEEGTRDSVRLSCLWIPSRKRKEVKEITPGSKETRKEVIDCRVKDGDKYTLMRNSGGNTVSGGILKGGSVNQLENSWECFNTAGASQTIRTKTKSKH